MAGSSATGEILSRALDYPYATPDRSYVYRDGGDLDLPPGGPDLTGRSALLAYGSNAAPSVLARKLAALPGSEMPVLRAELDGFDVVYSAHVTAYGAIPATLIESPGTVAPVFVGFPDPTQLELLTATEHGNYELVELTGLDCRLEPGGQAGELRAYLSRHGPLSLGSAEVALASLRSYGRRLLELDEPTVLARVRNALAPSLGLDEFVLDCVRRGGIAPLPEL